MIHTDQRFSEAVEARVTALERRTDAELVVVAAERSGSYADVTARAAFVGTLAVASVLLWAPFHFSEPAVLVDLALSWFVLERVCRDRRLVRRLTTARRRGEQAHAAAEREFHREVVHGTPNRSGVLVYVSALEGAVVVLPDLGVEGRIPRGALIDATEAFRHDDLEHFLAGLDALGDVLARHLPHTEGSDAVDLPNSPRVRP